ncbi:MAG: BLUF domain-containing protein [Neomegalonema sp.]|nr:BLUF domain-containing protein [Neomegalonema sp.]
MRLFETMRPEGAICQLTYVSRATPSLTPRGLQAISLVAQRNNEQNHVSGVLIECAGEFFQILEGPEAAVVETFARINKDPRHTDVTLLRQRLSDERSFSHWLMGCFAFRPEDLPDGFFFGKTRRGPGLRSDALERTEDMLRTFHEENAAAGLARSFQPLETA